MPIKFKCKCGQILSVSSKLAGKTGKCPGCAKAIKIPSAAPKAQAPAKPVPQPSAPVQSAPAAGFDPLANAMGDLLDDAGLTQSSGPTCPKCFQDLKPGSVVCIHCGFNFQSGEQLTSHEAAKEEEEFDNLYLKQAAENMKRDAVMDERINKASVPWWVLMSFLIGVVLACAAGVVIVDGKFSATPAPEDSFMGKIQRWPVFTTLGLTVMLTGTSIVVFANSSITYFGFKQSVQKGLMCLFMPILGSTTYGFMNWADNKAAVKAILMGLAIVGGGIAMIIQGGGFGIIFNAFR